MTLDTIEDQLNARMMHPGVDRVQIALMLNMITAAKHDINNLQAQIDALNNKISKLLDRPGFT